MSGIREKEGAKEEGGAGRGGAARRRGRSEGKLNESDRKKPAGGETTILRQRPPYEKEERPSKMVRMRTTDDGMTDDHRHESESKGY